MGKGTGFGGACVENGGSEQGPFQNQNVPHFAQCVQFIQHFALVRMPVHQRAGKKRIADNVDTSDAVIAVCLNEGVFVQRPNQELIMQFGQRMKIGLADKGIVQFLCSHSFTAFCLSYHSNIRSWSIFSLPINSASVKTVSLGSREPIRCSMLYLPALRMSFLKCSSCSKTARYNRSINC